MTLSKDEVTNSLRIFRARRDDLLHEDAAAFEHHLQRFVEYLQTDPLAQSVIEPLQQTFKPDVETWWAQCKADEERGAPRLAFPSVPDEELLLRFEVLRTAAAHPDWVYQFGYAFRKFKNSEGIELFRVVIVRPFADELTHRISEAANIASPEERALQAVPIARLTRESETRLFLSHKSVDKPLVYRYYHALKGLGFAPWLDDPAMPAGANLERELLRGFEESCAAVFFITENFKDENYLATEVDYAVAQKRKKGKKFAVITLRYSDAAPVPDLLTPFIYKTVSNDLEGFYELIRALPVELGPVRWKAEVAED